MGDVILKDGFITIQPKIDVDIGLVAKILSWSPLWNGKIKNVGRRKLLTLVKDEINRVGLDNLSDEYADVGVTEDFLELVIYKFSHTPKSKKGEQV